MSGLVPAVWINRLYAVVLIINCWSTAFLHKFLHINQLIKRLTLLVVDLLFDMTTNTAIPLAIFVPYYWEFDLRLRDFPIENYYNDVWLIQAISDNQQVFVTSWLDFISKTAPDIFIIFSISVLKRTIVIDTTPTTTKFTDSHRRVESENDSPMSGCGFKRAGIHRIVPRATTKLRVGDALRRLPAAASRSLSEVRRSSARLTSGQWRAVRTELFQNRKHVWHDLFFIVFGFAILTIHTHTTLVAVSAAGHGCMLAMRPWFATQPTCGSLEINCAHSQHNHGIGVNSLGTVFSQVDPKSLKALVLSSCANLHMPPAIQSLPALQMIKIYNSTVERWDATAELRDDRNPNLLFIYVCDSNFSTPGAVGELPVGMLGNNTPRQFVDAEFSGTNLVRLPADLHEKWTSIMYFVLERSPGIVEFPQTIVPMRIPQLMLGSNHIQSIPSNLLADQAFWKLMLDGNPLQDLPQTIGNVQALYKVGFAFTNVTALPAWATNRASSDVKPFLGFVDLVAGGTPLCASAEALASANAKVERWVVVDCSPRVQIHAYPVEREREW